MRPLADDELSWSWNQAKLRHTLGLMSTERWLAYLDLWRKRHGEYSANKGTLTLSGTIRKAYGSSKK